MSRVLALPVKLHEGYYRRRCQCHRGCTRWVVVADTGERSYKYAVNLKTIAVECQEERDAAFMAMYVRPQDQGA